MANSSTPWAAHGALMACCLVVVDKRPGVCPVVIGETLPRALAKLVMRATGYQASMACVNLQLCAGLEAGIEGATRAVGQKRLHRVKQRRNEEDAGSSDEEKETECVVVGLNNLTIETTGTEEVAVEVLVAELQMEIKEEGEVDSEVKEEGDGTHGSLVDLEFLTQDAEPIGTTLVDAHNGFKELSRLAMIWTVRHRWPAGARFTFNC